VLRQILQC